MKLVDIHTLKTYDAQRKIWQSDEGNLLDLQFDAHFDKKKIGHRPPDLWRYREAIPISNDRHIISFKEGFTPLITVDVDGKKTLIKQEQLFGTGSYKDRGATVLMSHVKELGIQDVVQDSSGNAGCAIAAYSALAGITCTIYLQQETAPSKIAQMKAYGAGIRFIDGTREDVATTTLLAAQHTYYASHSWNPFFMHGTKTFAYEVCEQLGWKVPDSVVLPAGNGTLVLGCYIGFSDLLKAGIISKMPKLIAVQSENCAPLANAFNANLETYPTIETTSTIAEGIAIAKPIRGNQIIDYIRKSNGYFITVNESEIKAAWKECAQKGFFIEPTSAVAIAGLRKHIAGFSDETIVSLFSGNGLKSVDKIMKMI